MRLTSSGRDGGASSLQRLGVVVALLVATSCTTEGAFRQDRRLKILSPRSRDTVELPVVVRWSAKDFTVTGLDGSERDDAGLFAVFVDRAPVRPGRNLSDLASDDTSCEQTPGCPDDAWFAERGVYRTEQNGLELASLVDTRPSGRRDAKDSHEVTVILVNGRGERIGESGATRQFFVNRVRRP